ncbi:Zinc finger protein hangover [Melipona quadrifasciata]|uniref:Zinc finger protein hangover n=1 Tax=Melipona quadrifasciata TaxID=166423 RepID=A0A0M8ZUN2_9HYME|nr:Zinc finger protein hangover [Melipona quadrifasciata]
MDKVAELQNVENVCRLCLSTDEPKLSVFEMEDSLLSMASKIQACLSIQISTTDKLSTQICAQCVKNVNQWHSYKETCLSSQEKLHQWLERQHVQQSPMVVTIKDEPVDLDFYEDNIEVISESTDSNLKITPSYRQEDRQTPSAMDAMSAGRKSVMCHVCRKFFANMSVLYKHKQLVHKTHTNLVKNFTKSYQMECIPLPSSDGKVSCNVCYKKFPGVSNLRQHFTVKHKNAPVKYACTVDGCKLTFPTPMILKNHEMSHTSIIFSCNLCNRHVFNRPAMSNHILTVHNIVYNAESSKNFHRELDLGKYVVEGAVDATCPQCKIKYPNNRAMKIHYFKYHENSNE